MDTSFALAVVGLAIAIFSLLLNLGSKIWRAPDSLVSRISLLIQVITLLALFYLGLRMLGL